MSLKKFVWIQEATFTTNGQTKIVAQHFKKKNLRENNQNIITFFYTRPKYLHFPEEALRSGARTSIILKQ